MSPPSSGGQAVAARPPLLRGGAVVPRRGAFRADVEGLRAVAVVLVVLYHAGVPGVTGGYVGVDVFFVLSGFLITGLLLRELRTTGTVSLRQFYARRVRRLLPLASLVLVVTTLASLVLLPPLDRGSVAADARAAALYVANGWFALTDADYTSPERRSPLLHLWSLSVEEQFYAVWPLLLLGTVALGRGRGRTWWVGARRRSVLVVVVLGAVSLALSAALSSGLGPWAYYGLHTRAWELLAGAGLALAVPSLRRLPASTRVVAGWSGLALVVGAALVLDDTTAFPGTAAAWPVVGTLLVLGAGTGRGPAVGAGAALSTAVPRYLGRISYGWYLWHWPCLVLLAGVGRSAEGETLGAQRVLLAVLVSLALAALSSVLVEQPVRTSRALAADPGRTLLLGAGLTAVVVALSLLPAGAPARAAADLPPVLRQTPLEARGDLPTDTQGCYLPFAGTAVGECRLETGGSRTVVLVGDSHAVQWLPAVRQAARDADWTLYFFAKQLCPVTDVAIWAPVRRGSYPECSTWRAQVLARLAALPDVDAVVLGRRSEYGDRLAGPDGERLAPVPAGQAWAEGTRRTLAALSAVTPRVVLLEPVPFPAFDVPACVSDAGGRWEQCSFPRGQASVSRTTVDQAERAALQGSGDLVGRVDLTDRICPDDPCRVVGPSGVLVYRDEQHLSASFTATLSAAFAERLERLLP